MVDMADDDVEQSAAAAEHAVRRELHRVRRVADRHGRSARIAAVVLGIVLLVIGIALLFIPGPGVIVIVFGVAALAAGIPRLQRPLLSAAAFAGRMGGRIRRSPLLMVVVGAFGLAVAALMLYLLLAR